MSVSVWSPPYRVGASSLKLFSQLGFRMVYKFESNKFEIVFCFSKPVLSGGCKLWVFSLYVVIIFSQIPMYTFYRHPFK